MLTPKPQLSLRNAKDYFREHLGVGDYYAETQHVAGEWFGLGADRLGLQGKVSEAHFLRLCEGLHPHTGERLTQRMNTNRITEDGMTVANRRVFYDFTISPPKSVSVVALLQDDRILQQHDRAVRIAMSELEKFAEARLRKKGEHGQRVTGNVIAAAFRHDTSRELDPHLHTHCVVLNATFDAAEHRWKALEVQGMFCAQKFAENLYYHELAKGLRSLGYAIENNRWDFEIVGVLASVIARFSKRHQQIDDEARKRLERDGGDANTVRRQVARDARRRKIKDATAETLRPSWRRQLTADEGAALAGLRTSARDSAENVDVGAAVRWADEHLFERRSVVRDYELWSAALARGRGGDFGVETLRAAVDERGYVREAGTRKLTSREVLRCELAIVVAAKDGRNRHAPLSPAHTAADALSTEQRQAVWQILGSRDFITLFRGGAGTGKSFTLKEVERGLHAAGRPVVVLAPQRQQVRDLQADGLPAETLARFLETRQLARGAVVIVDEAGQIGGRQLRDLIRVVQGGAGRIILSGDTRQHGAVAASDALRAIERHAGLRPAVIREIRRQNPKLARTTAERDFIRRYRSAVKSAARGEIAASFTQLETLGCVRDVADSERGAVVAKEFCAAVGRGEKTLVVAQTREEVRAVNDAIRDALHAEGKLGPDTTLTVCQPVDLGEAEKRDPRSYQPGQQAFFLKSYGRFKKGDFAEIAVATGRGLFLLKDGRRSAFSYRYAARIAVATAAPLTVAPGDRLQLKFNGRSSEGTRLDNGELVTVRRVRADGGLVVEDDAGTRKTLAPTQRLFQRGYAVTSYASQGKTVDTVLLADANHRAATNAEQWYVTISRGRKRVVIFTSDREALRENVERFGARELALDLKVAPPAPAEMPAQRLRASALHLGRQRARALIELARRQRFLARLRSEAPARQATKISSS